LDDNFRSEIYKFELRRSKNFEAHYNMLKDFYKVADQILKLHQKGYYLINQVMRF